MIGVHVANVDDVSAAEPVLPVGRGFMEEPPATGKGRAGQPGVKHHGTATQLQLHTRMSQVRYLREQIKPYVSRIVHFYKNMTFGTDTL